MKEILLTQDKVALVDDCDFGELSLFKWYATRDTKNSNWYAGRNQRKPDGKYKTIAMHRQIMGVTDTRIKVDHINHNGLDNQRANIRLCSHSQNLSNQLTRTNLKSSKFKGVSFNKALSKWKAYIVVHRMLIYLGVFTSELEAAKAYDAAAIQHFGEFAHLNLPQ